jgi:hypothetical protein
MYNLDHKMSSSIFGNYVGLRASCVVGSLRSVSRNEYRPLFTLAEIIDALLYVSRQIPLTRDSCLKVLFGAATVLG